MHKLCDGDRAIVWEEGANGIDTATVVAKGLGDHDHQGNHLSVHIVVARGIEVATDDVKCVGNAKLLDVVGDGLHHPRSGAGRGGEGGLVEIRHRDGRAIAPSGVKAGGII